MKAKANFSLACRYFEIRFFYVSISYTEFLKPFILWWERWNNGSNVAVTQVNLTTAVEDLSF